MDKRHQADVAGGAELAQAMRVPWAEHGTVAKCFDALELWRERPDNVSGLSLPCGHYIAEEVPAFLMDEASHLFATEFSNLNQERQA